MKVLCYWLSCFNWFDSHISKMQGMYPTLHEADITKFVGIMHEKMKAAYPETNLKRLRTLAGLSQSELARQSGVSLRQIQLFEQRQRDINRTQALNLLRLARVLCCRMEDLVEHTRASAPPNPFVVPCTLFLPHRVSPAFFLCNLLTV